MRILGVLLWLALLGVTQPGYAQAPGAGDDAASTPPENVEAARQLAKSGLAAIKAGRFEDAIPALTRSLELHRAPFTLYALGLAYQGAQRPAAALESFRQFLALPSTQAMKAYEAPAREAVAELEGQVAHVTISVTPAEVEGLSLRVDGVTIPTAALGLARLIDPGDHLIEAAAPGYRDATRQLHLDAQAATDVALRLEVDPTAVPSDVPAAPPAEEGSGMLAAQATLIAVGTVALGAGITVGMLGYAQAKDAQYNDDGDAKAARTKSLVGDVLAVSGGVVAGASLIWLLVDVLAVDDAATDADIAVALWSDGALLGIQLCF